MITDPLVGDTRASKSDSDNLHEQYRTIQNNWLGIQEHLEYKTICTSDTERYRTIGWVYKSTRNIQNDSHKQYTQQYRKIDWVYKSIQNIWNDFARAIQYHTEQSVGYKSMPNGLHNRLEQYRLI